MPNQKKAKNQPKKQQDRVIATYLQRSSETKDELPRFLIVCEGAKTEPIYFQAIAAELRLSVNVLIEGLGDNTDSLVEQAIELKGQDDYLQAWCVFDRDSFPPNRFNRAIQMAESNDIRVAYSNEAFELWFILHFEYLQAGLQRGDYEPKLTALLGRKYTKTLSLYQELKPRQPTAIRNAERLLDTYSPCNPEQDNPSTTVHLLVCELNRFSRLPQAAP